MIKKVADSMVGLRASGWSILANGYGQSINIVLQLTTVPVFIGALGAPAYGKWLLLSSVPAYLAVADGGICSVASNRMSIEREKGDHSASNAIFQTALATVFWLFLGIATLGASAAWIVFKSGTVDISDILVLSILAAVALLNMAQAMVDAVFRAVGRYALGETITINLRLIEWMGIPLGLLFGKSLFWAAFSMLLLRLIGSSLVLIYVRRNIKEYVWNLAGWQRSRFAEMWRPGLAFLGLPVAFGLMVQGVVIVVATNLGFTEAAKFGVLRTFSRIPTQVMAVICRGIAPQISVGFAHGNLEALRRLVRDAATLGLSIAGASAFILWIFSPLVLRAWTHDEIKAGYGIVALFMFWGLSSATFQVAHTVLLATNTHSMYALAASLIALIGTAVTWGSSALLGLPGVAVCQSVTELLIGFVAFRIVATLFRSLKAVVPGSV